MSLASGTRLGPYAIQSAERNAWSIVRRSEFGTVALLAGLSTLVLFLASCGGGPSSPTGPTPPPTSPARSAPAPSGPANLTTTVDVYNATTGFITSVTRPANHGDRITLVLAELGIPGVDTRFASLREVSGADNMVGKHIANCTTGTLSFTADQSRTRVTLWLFDATNGSEYYSLYFGEELGWGYVIGGVGQNLYKNRRVWTASVLGAGAQAFGESSAACPTGLWSGVAEDGTAGAIEQANRAWNPFGVVYARITDVGASGVEADLTNGCFSNRTGPLTYQGLTQSWINVAWYALSAWRPTAVRELARRVGDVGFVPSLLRTPAFEHGMILARGRDDLIFLVLMPPV